MLKLLNNFTLNLARPYLKFTSEIIFNPSETALKIKRSQDLEMSPYNYVQQGVACIIGIWILSYSLTMRKAAVLSLACPTPW
jgi:hypothetical protein